MPLKKGKDRETRGENIKEMVDSPTFAKGKSAGKKRQMAIAAAFEQQGRSRTHDKNPVHVRISIHRGEENE